MAGIPVPPHLLLNKGRGGSNQTPQERNKRAYFDTSQQSFNKRPHLEQGTSNTRPLINNQPRQHLSSTCFPSPQFKSNMGQGQQKQNEILTFLKRFQRPVSTKEIITSCGAQCKDSLMSVIFDLSDRGIIKRAPGRIQAWRVNNTTEPLPSFEELTKKQNNSNSIDLSAHAQTSTGPPMPPHMLTTTKVNPTRDDRRSFNGSADSSQLSWRSQQSTSSHSDTTGMSSSGGMPIPPHKHNIQSSGSTSHKQNTHMSGGPPQPPHMLNTSTSRGPPQPPHMLNTSMSRPPPQPPHLLNSSTSKGLLPLPYSLNASKSNKPPSAPHLLNSQRSEPIDREITNKDNSVGENNEQKTNEGSVMSRNVKEEATSSPSGATNETMSVEEYVEISPLPRETKDLASLRGKEEVSLSPCLEETQDISHPAIDKPSEITKAGDPPMPPHTLTRKGGSVIKDGPTVLEEVKEEVLSPLGVVEETMRVQGMSTSPCPHETHTPQTQTNSINSNSRLPFVGRPPAPPHIMSGKNGPPMPPHLLTGKAGSTSSPHRPMGQHTHVSTTTTRNIPTPQSNSYSQPSIEKSPEPKKPGGPPAPPHVISGKGGPPMPPHMLTGKGGPTLPSHRPMGQNVNAKGPPPVPHLLNAQSGGQETINSNNIKQSGGNIDAARSSLLRPAYLDDSTGSDQNRNSSTMSSSSRNIPLPPHNRNITSFSGPPAPPHMQNVPMSKGPPQPPSRNATNKSSGGRPTPPHVITGKGGPPMPPHMLTGTGRPTLPSQRPMGQHVHASATSVNTPSPQGNSTNSYTQRSVEKLPEPKKPGGPPTPPHIISGKGGPPMPPHMLTGKGGPTLPSHVLRAGNMQNRHTAPQNLPRTPNMPIRRVNPPPQPPRNQSSQQSCSMLSADAFNSLNKNPVSALNELAQKQGKEVTFELISQSKGGKNKFTVACKIGGHLYDAVSGPNMKEARRDASDTALRAIMGQNAFNVKAAGTKDVITNLRNPPRTGLPHFDNIAFLCNHAFMQLSTMIKTNFAGKKVIAGIVMKQGETDGGRVVSMGSGNRCITGERLSLEGKVVNDSHAEIICRRGFIRFLYSELDKFIGNDNSSIFTTCTNEKNKAKIKDGISFHLYISTAPCGDGALFTPRENQSMSALPTAHNPEFTSKVQGVLRTKIEDGEGTIPIPYDEREQTMDGIMRGQRLRTMACSDKVCRWNVLGLQGSLLSNLIQPVYLKSLALGYLFDHGHLSRALCCRLEKETKLELPVPFSVNHLWLGRITKYDVSRETEKTNNISTNWCACDTAPEVTDGRIGAQLERSNYAPTVSRLCKLELFRRFREVCTKSGKFNDLLSLETYAEVKQAATDFQTAKKQMLERFRKGKFGNWLSKPAEQDISIGIPK